MKNSLRILVVVLIIIALIAGGATLGALLPVQIKLYTTVTIAAIAALALILIGFNGRRKDEDE